MSLLISPHAIFGNRVSLTEAFKVYVASLDEISENKETIIHLYQTGNLDFYWRYQNKDIPIEVGTFIGSLSKTDHEEYGLLYTHCLNFYAIIRTFEKIVIYKKDNIKDKDFVPIIDKTKRHLFFQNDALLLFIHRGKSREMEIAFSKEVFDFIYIVKQQTDSPMPEKSRLELLLPELRRLLQEVYPGKYPNMLTHSQIRAVVNDEFTKESGFPLSKEQQIALVHIAIPYAQDSLLENDGEFPTKES